MPPGGDGLQRERVQALVALAGGFQVLARARELRRVDHDEIERARRRRLQVAKRVGFDRIDGDAVGRGVGGDARDGARRAVDRGHGRRARRAPRRARSRPRRRSTSSTRAPRARPATRARVSRWSMNMPVFCPDSGSTSSATPFSTTGTAAREAPRATREPAA